MNRAQRRALLYSLRRKKDTQKRLGAQKHEARAEHKAKVKRRKANKFDAQGRRLVQYANAMAERQGWQPIDWVGGDTSA